MSKLTKKPLLMLCDDDYDDQYLVRCALAKVRGAPELICAEHGADLIAILEQRKEDGDNMPDVVLLDLNMPVLDGKQTLKLLKSSAHFSMIPVVIYTTSNANQELQECYKIGANAYCIKPGSYQEMISMLQHFCDFWFQTSLLTSMRKR